MTMPMTSLGNILSRQEVLDVVWQRLAILAVDITRQADGSVDGSGRILLANQAAEHLFGYDMVGVLRGKYVEALIPADRRKHHAAHVARYAGTPGHRGMGNRDMELLGQRRDGTTFPLAIELIPAIIQDLPCTIAVITDMTGRVLHVPNGEPIHHVVADPHHTVDDHKER